MNWHLQDDDRGHFGSSVLHPQPKSGYVVHIKPVPTDSSQSGCLLPPSYISDRWIALIKKSTKENCKTSRILNLAYLRNASAVVFYGRNSFSDQDSQGRKTKGLFDSQNNNAKFLSISMYFCCHFQALQSCNCISTRKV